MTSLREPGSRPRAELREHVLERGMTHVRSTTTTPMAMRDVASG
jgi:hypothetical protein